MENSRKTIVGFLLDETGSMITCKEATISGFNEYIKTLKKEKNVFVTLTKFNSKKVQIVYSEKAISKVPELDNKNYTPMELTPLYDAIGRTIIDIEKTAKKADKVLIVIMTDGQENCSKEYTRTDIFTLIKEKEKLGWTFVYLGADHNAYQESQKFGVAAGNTMQFNKTETRATFSSLASRTVMFARGHKSEDGFFR